jgi:hypothetical protein
MHKSLTALALAALAIGAGAMQADAAVTAQLRQRGAQVALNPQPLPPGPDKSPGIHRFSPGQRLMLNPQPPVPRQLPPR